MEIIFPLHIAFFCPMEFSFGPVHVFFQAYLPAILFHFKQQVLGGTVGY